MIQLELSKKPSKLTKEVQKKLTKVFIDSDKKKAVWKKTYIANAVKKLAYGKCCFSEIYLDTRSTYTEIEHFFPKELYPNKVVTWGNLLPSSKKCNTSKGKIDTGKHTIVNPFIDNPEEHLYFENFRLYPKNGSIVGKNTISIVALNDHMHFVKPRAEAALKLLDAIEDFYNQYIDNDALKHLPDIQKRNRINRIKGYLSDVNRKTEFSACLATTLMDSLYYKDTIAYLRQNNLWDDELEIYCKELQFCYLGK